MSIMRATSGVNLNFFDVNVLNVLFCVKLHHFIIEKNIFLALERSILQRVTGFVLYRLTRLTQAGVNVIKLFTTVNYEFSE